MSSGEKTLAQGTNLVPVAQWRNFLAWRERKLAKNAAKFALHPWRDALRWAPAFGVIVFVTELHTGVVSAAVGAVVFALLWVVAYRFIGGPWLKRRADRTRAPR